MIRTMFSYGWVWVVACGSPTGRLEGTSEAPQTPWLKGQLHAHSNRSGDSQTAPADVAAWYRAHHFDFIVLTDHNVVGGLAAADTPAGLIVLPGIELTMNLMTCEPREGDHPCLLHVNALAVDAETGSVRAPGVDDDRERILTSELELARKLGGVPQLNHPNFHYSANAALIARLAAGRPLLVEIENQTSDSMNEGDANHPSTQVVWDQALALGATIYGTATDDSHHYDDAERVRARGEAAFTGDRGWVMVHASRDVASIRAALARGDFYATTGVTLEAIAIDERAVTVRSSGAATLRCITDGVVGVPVEGREIFCPRVPGTVRVTVSAGGRDAWVQPVRGVGSVSLRSDRAPRS